MKMLTALSVAALALFVTTHAQAASKSEIWELLQRIDNELQNYQQSPQELDIVQHKLEEALSTLRGRPIENPHECREFAYAEYLKDGYSNSISLERARAYCAKVNSTGITMPVLKFFYTNLKKDGYSVSIALDQTLDISAGVVEGDLSCLETALGRYRKDGYGMRLALQKSVEYCAVPKI